MSLLYPKNVRAVEEMLNSFMPFAQERMGYAEAPDIRLAKDPDNAQDPLGKTAYYEPQHKRITVYIDGRHVKDIMRSISHEMVHHAQNLRGDLAGSAGVGEQGYAQNDEHLREMEREAYEQGNLCFRDWEDGIKAGGLYEAFDRGDLISMIRDYSKDLTGSRDDYGDIEKLEKMSDEQLQAYYQGMSDSPEAQDMERRFRDEEEAEMGTDSDFDRMPKQSGMSRGLREANMFDKRREKLNKRLMENFGYKLPVKEASSAIESFADAFWDNVENMPYGSEEQDGALVLDYRGVIGAVIYEDEQGAWIDIDGLAGKIRDPIEAAEAVDQMVSGGRKSYSTNAGDPSKSDPLYEADHRPFQIGDYVRITDGGLRGAAGKIIELVELVTGEDGFVVLLDNPADKRVFGQAGDEVIVAADKVEPPVSAMQESGYKWDSTSELEKAMSGMDKETFKQVLKDVQKQLGLSDEEMAQKIMKFVNSGLEENMGASPTQMAMAFMNSRGYNTANIDVLELVAHLRAAGAKTQEDVQTAVIDFLQQNDISVQEEMSKRDFVNQAWEKAGATSRHVSDEEAGAVESFNNWRAADPRRESDWEEAQSYRGGRVLAMHIKDSNTIDPATGRAKVIQKYYDVQKDMYVDDSEMDAILPESVKFQNVLKTKLQTIFKKHPHLAENKEFINKLKIGLKTTLTEKYKK